MHAIALFVPASFAAKVPAIFECEGCAVSAPVVTGPHLGDLVARKDGAVLVPGVECVGELDFLAEETEWSDWSRKRRTPEGLSVSADDLGAFFPVRALGRKSAGTLALSLDGPVARRIAVGSAERVLGDACTAALANALCEDGDLGGVAMVTGVWGAAGATVKASGTFDADALDVEWKKDGEPPWTAALAGASRLSIASRELLVIGIATSAVDPGAAAVAEMKKGCVGKK